MRASPKFLIPMVAASLLLAACGSSSKSSSGATSPSRPASPTAANGSSGVLVRTGSNAAVGGTILVNSQGITLYHLTGEQSGKFICTSSTCVQVWHPLTVPSGGKPSGTVGSLGVVKRPGGAEQVTYKGMPLYTFAQDTAPGQANGQGFKDVGTWSAVTAGATQASAPAAPPPATTPPSSGY